jgi:hypothetical protein
MNDKEFEKVDINDVLKFEPRLIPLFWMNETTGMMKSIVLKYLESKHLTNLELKYLRWYLVQYIDAMISKPPNYKEEINKRDQKGLEDYIEVLLDFGIDPF